MGGSPSKRKLTIENEDPTSVIKVSENVVDRIRGNIQNTVRTQEATPDPINTVPVYMCEPSLTSIQLRQAHIKELKCNDDYWKQREKQLEEQHQSMNELLQSEYEKAKEEIQSSTPPKVVTDMRPPCKELKEAVIDCYKCYPDQPMRCAKIVKAYHFCVEKFRYEVMAQQKRG